jgi:hypothetical protein
MEALKMNNDDFLREHAREPRPEFARDLRDRLRDLEPAPRARRAAAWRPALAGAFALALVVSAFAFPAVRASGQAFLDLFRVRNFAAVPVDFKRVKQLDEGHFDMKTFMADRVDTLEAPGQPVFFTTPAAAGAAAGLDVAAPSFLPRGLVRDTIVVERPGSARVTLDGARLKTLLDAFDVKGVTVPANLDGAKLTVRTTPIVMLHYASPSGARANLVQARSPEVSLPPGVDLAQLGEIGLRILGLEAPEAHRFAQQIDWHSTLLVPVPTDAGEFREVTVNGQRGLLITSSEAEGGGARRHGPRNMVLWADGQKVYGLMGSLGREELVQMANSVR